MNQKRKKKKFEPNRERKREKGRKKNFHVEPGYLLIFELY